MVTARTNVAERSPISDTVAGGRFFFEEDRKGHLFAAGPGGAHGFPTDGTHLRSDSVMAVPAAPAGRRGAGLGA